MSIPIIDVEKEFAEFLEQHGACISDKTLTGANKPTNADYIFHTELVVAELKLLKKNPFDNKDFLKSIASKQSDWIKKGHITTAQLQQIK